MTIAGSMRLGPTCCDIKSYGRLHHQWRCELPLRAKWLATRQQYTGWWMMRRGQIINVHRRTHMSQSEPRNTITSHERGGKPETFDGPDNLITPKMSATQPHARSRCWFYPEATFSLVNMSRIKPTHVPRRREKRNQYIMRVPTCLVSSRPCSPAQRVQRPTTLGPRA